jgi:KipI family sensor histidine kinase inhibitor
VSGRLSVVAYGEGAALVDLDAADAPDRAERTHALASAMAAALPGADVVVGAGTVLVVGASIEEVERVAAAPVIGARAHFEPRTHTIAAAYDGPDLSAVAEALGVTRDEVIARHTGVEHGVELVGFLPGFAYLSSRDGARLAVPRRRSPRPRVPAGSIALAASFTGIYPSASPGGWNLIGRALDAVPFDPERDPPVLFRPGDRVRFVETRAPDAPSPQQAKGALDAVEEGPRSLRVLAAPACATVQDGGRPGQLARGIPASGPLDPGAFEAANAAVGNPPGAAAVEVPLGSLEIEARGGSAVVSVDGEAAVRLAEGEHLRVAESDRAVRYLAVRGGIDVPVVMGSRATLLPARVGGHLGRPLRKGDVLRVGGAEGDPSVTSRGVIGSSEELAVVPGPHVGRFPAGAYGALLAGVWRVSRLGDRVGVRLEGSRVPRDEPDLALPVPMIRGAVEVTTDGTPIVLGPDHPTTGGYPVLAVLLPAAQAALARRKPGEAVRLRDAGGSR